MMDATTDLKAAGLYNIQKSISFYCHVENRGMKVRIYLDNCSYNRPYDNQSQMKIYLETQAKLHIQDIGYDRER